MLTHRKCPSDDWCSCCLKLAEWHIDPGPPRTWLILGSKMRALESLMNKSDGGTGTFDRYPFALVNSKSRKATTSRSLLTYPRTVERLLNLTQNTSLSDLNSVHSGSLINIVLRCWYHPLLLNCPGSASEEPSSKSSASEKVKSGQEIREIKEFSRRRDRSMTRKQPEPKKKHVEGLRPGQIGAKLWGKLLM